MATRLIQVVSFANVPASGTVNLPHNININGTQKKPDYVAADTAGFTIAVTATQVSVTNTNAAPASVNVWLELKHSIPRELGGAAQNLTPQPFVAAAGGSGGGPSTPQAVVFDDAVAADKVNIRSDRATNQSPIDNTKVGITNLGSRSTGASVGATENYATIGGGDQNTASGLNACVPGGKNSTASGESSFACNEDSLASGLQSFACCDGQATGDWAMAGADSIASGVNSVALGGSSAGGDYATALGDSCTANGGGSFAAGRSCTASATRAVAIGEGCTASAANAVAIGNGANATVGANALAIGHSASAAAAEAIAIGHSALAGATEAIALGNGASAQSTKSFALLGGQVPANNQYGMSFGLQSQAERPTQVTWASGAYATNGTGGQRGSAQTSFLLFQGTAIGSGVGESVELVTRDDSLNLAAYFVPEDNRAYAMVVTCIAAGQTDPGGGNLDAVKTFRQVFTVAQRIGGIATAILTTPDEVTSSNAEAASFTLTPTIDVPNSRLALTFTTGTKIAVVAILAKVEFTEVGGW